MKKRSVATVWIFVPLIAAGSAAAAGPAPDQLLPSRLPARHATAETAVAERAERARLADMILDARAGTPSRQPDWSYRAQWREQLLPLSSEALRSFLESGANGNLYSLSGTKSVVPAPSPNLLGDSSADLAYTPVTPCRVLDTRIATRGDLGGSPLHVGTAYDFIVAGTGFAGQGGVPGGCGVPYGPATAVVVNFVATQGTGVGNLREWAWSSPALAAPNAVVLNYVNAAAGGPTALDNAVIVPICDLATGSTCGSDFFLQVFGHDAHVVADVLGYYRKIDMPMGSVRLTYFTVGVASSVTVLDPGGFVPSRNMGCMVQLHSGATNDTPGSGPTGAFVETSPILSDSTSATTQGGTTWAELLGVGGKIGSGGVSDIYQVVAGHSYKFGVVVDAWGSFVNFTLVDSYVSWSCR